MSNTLEEYKIQKVDKYRETWENGGAVPEIHQGFEDGFDACLALDLPIKFSKWLNRNFTIWRSGWMPNSNYIYECEGKVRDTTPKDVKTEEWLYKHFIENILKLE